MNGEMHQICCIVAAGKRALQYGEPIQYTPAQYENAITFSCLPGKLFSAKIFHRTISSNGMIRYYCPSPKIRKPQSAFPIRFFIGRKIHFDLSNVRRNSKPDKILNDRTRKKPFSSIRRSKYDPFIVRLSKSCQKGLKQAKKEKSVRTSPARKLAAAPLAIQSFFTRCTGGQTIKASPVR